SQIQGYRLWLMPAMDFCNTMEFPLAIFCILLLQHSVFLLYNKHIYVYCIYKGADYMDYKLLGKRVRIQRTKQGLTQEKLAELCGISVSVKYTIT
ncbi:MAG: helix-turn-helix domain-containing protein, partial [Desulfobacterales bacterium]|nr:helix-turn-helix domain-containing protein [Desulfobacterales bacterium]